MSGGHGSNNIELRHQSLNVLSWGIQRSNKLLDSDYLSNGYCTLKSILPVQFKATQSFSMHSYIGERSSLPKNFQFKEYMPAVFTVLKRKFKIPESVILNSFKTAPEVTDAHGKSGAKLFLTNNKYFFIKTMTHQEVKKLCNRYLPTFYQYLSSNEEVETLLPQYIGVFRVNVNKKIFYYCIIRSLFNTEKKVDKKYDLKGCIVDRLATTKEKSHSFPTYKDADFINDGVKVHMTKENIENFIKTMEKDIQFLGEENLMDYSLLVGICHNEHVDDNNRDLQTNNDYNQDYYAHISGDGQLTYYMGVIDILTYYNTNKKTNHVYKTMRHGVNADVSTVNAQFYQQRFLDFMKKIFEET